VFDASIIRATVTIGLMQVAASTSEMLVNSYQTTQHNNPEDSHLHTCHCENLIKFWEKYTHLWPLRNADSSHDGKHLLGLLVS
jgi:hypothetical protein